jgi:hypothetical protein
MFLMTNRPSRAVDTFVSQCYSNKENHRISHELLHIHLHGQIGVG